MCGLSGWLDFEKNLENYNEIIEKMTKTMSNRGPDAEGIWIDNHIGLGHRRLSIIDIEGGIQPMIYNTIQNQKIVISYVGEVYNFIELRNDLVKLGHIFETNSDTEVVLKSYIQWGEDFVSKLNGMYGFAIWDSRKDTLLLVRDRMGVKPLFYYETSSGIIFSSEPKGILANPTVRREIDADGFRELLELVKTPSAAIFSGMKEVIPGEFIRYNRKGLSKHIYWKLEAKEHEDNLETTIQHTRSLLEDIIQRQMITDVPLCVLLSGGLDSSTVTSMAQNILKANSKTIKTFSLDFKDHGSAFVSDGFRVTPDTPFVKDLVNWVKSDHKQIILDSSTLAENWLHNAVVNALDIPPAYWADLYPSLYRLFQEIKKECKVALSGEAADEVFGGYRWFHDNDAIAAETFPWLSKATANLFDGKSFFNSSFIQSLQMDEFLKDSYQTALNNVPVLKSDSAENLRMRKMTHIHLTRYVQSLLDRKDRMSMAVGLELRVPFCDHRLVEYAFNIPWEMKKFDRREKSILRAAAKDLLPPSIVQRIKNPYPATQDPAYEIELRKKTKFVIEDKTSNLSQLLNVNKIKDFLSNEISDYSPLHNRMAMERIVGIHTWTKEYNVEYNL